MPAPDPFEILYSRYHSFVNHISGLEYASPSRPYFFIQTSHELLNVLYPWNAEKNTARTTSANCGK